MSEGKRPSLQEILEDTNLTWEGVPVFRFKQDSGMLIVYCGETHIVEIEYQQGFELNVSILEEKGSSADVVHDHTVSLEE